MLSTLKRRLSSIPEVVWVLALTFACLAPFLGKAFHIDDTLFLRVAEQIQKHPLDFYGCQMNWFGTTRPMIDDFDNPPLACYYIALVASIGGWSEPVLHLGFLLPALAVAWGVFSLGRYHGNRPLVAATAAILTPVFLISATMLMCDALLLAFWVWSVVFFERGLRERRVSLFISSGILIGLAFWTKYSALAIVPLLAAYGLSRERRAGNWLAAVLAPLVFVATYEWVTTRLYGRGLLSGAASFSAGSSAIPHGQVVERELVGLSFLGGCFLPVLFYAPWLWSRRDLVKGACLIAPCLALPLFLEPWHKFIWGAERSFHGIIFLQSALFLTAGIHILILAGADFWRHRDASSLLLVLWVLGVFVFTTTFNWTINGRSLLPCLPAIGILVSRRIEQQVSKNSTLPELWLSWPVIGSAIISLFVTQTDTVLANNARTAAREICLKYPQVGRTLWFEGHWGFQYYMEKEHARPLPRIFDSPSPGDILVIPGGTVNFFDVPQSFVKPLETLKYPASLACSTMNRAAGAAFFASVWGPFPFSITHGEPQSYYVFRVTRGATTPTKDPGNPLSKGAVGQLIELERQVRTNSQATSPQPGNANGPIQAETSTIAR